MTKRSLTHIFLLLLALQGLISAGCRPKSGPGEEAPSVGKPYAIIYENRIMADVIGQKLSDPIGLASDDAGNLYVVDAGNNRLVKFDRELKPMRETGGYGISETLFNSPNYISIDNNLNLYIADAGNRRISIYDSRLNYVNMIDFFDADDPARFGRPGGLAINDYGELWISDPDNSRVAVFDSNTEFDRFVGDVRTYSGLLLTPGAAARGLKGRILVSDEGKGRVYVFDSFGIYLFDFGYDVFKRPAGLKVDRYGNIWVVDSKLSSVFCFDRDGILLYSVGEYGTTGEYELNQPGDVALLPGDRIAVSDTGNDRIMIYKIIYPE